MEGDIIPGVAIVTPVPISGKLNDEETVVVVVVSEGEDDPIWLLITTCILA